MTATKQRPLHLWAWVAYPEMAPLDCLPPDLTPTDETAWPPCHEPHPQGYLCTRLLGHTKRHAAGNGDVIVAVWS